MTVVHSAMPTWDCGILAEIQGMPEVAAKHFHNNLKSEYFACLTNQTKIMIPKAARSAPVKGNNTPKGAGGVGPNRQGVGLLQVCPAGCPTWVGVLHYHTARFWEVTDC